MSRTIIPEAKTYVSGTCSTQDERWVVKIAELPHRLSSEGWKPGILANTDMIAMLFNQ
jgi:hypothetical protein